jgi:hypothetical protein
MCFPWPTLSAPARAQELAAQKTEMLVKVTQLRKELSDWRAKLDGQVKNYREVSAAPFSTPAAAATQPAVPAVRSVPLLPNPPRRTSGT